MNLRTLLDSGPHAIDGGLASELEARGHELGDTLWSARVLADQPGEVLAAHQAYVEAGARVLVTASYQVSRQGFIASGRVPEAADDALRASVAIARQAAEGRDALVAASVGPYGAILHDGSEYRGRYGVSREFLIDFHSQRLEILVSAAPDLLAIETIPDVDEISAIVEALAAFPATPAWVSFSCRDRQSTCAGQPIEEAAIVAAESPSVMAVGVNCTDPTYVSSLLGRLSVTTDLALLAYPNAGGSYDPVRGWEGVGSPNDMETVREWASIDGVALIGGCCGVGPDQVARIAETLRS